MNSTLIIGIGSSGLAVIEEAEHYHYDCTGKNKSGSNVEYLYIETDTRRLPKKNSSSVTDITQVDFSLGQNAVDINQLKSNKDIDSDWIPEASSILRNMSGAGGMPSYGRLSLWGKSNYDKIKNVIKSKYEKIEGNNETIILSVGSLTGGTGSGICVDVAYLVREITKNENINAIFLIPDGNSFGVNKSIHENALSAMSAIDFYSKNEFKCTWPDNAKTKDARPPFRTVQYLSQDFSGAKASISSLEELIRVAGVITCLHFLDTEKSGNYFYDLVSKRRIDSAGNNRIKTIITSGFLMLSFPKAKLEELLSINITKNLLFNLINNKQFIDSFGNKRNIESELSIIKNDVKNSFEDIINLIFEELNSLKTSKGFDLMTSLKMEINDIQKNTSKTYNKSVYELFNTKSSNNYYEIIRNNTSLIRDSFIDKLREKIIGITSKYQNFQVSKIYIENYINEIENISKFYKNEYNLTGKDTEWDKLLQVEIKNYQSLYNISKAIFSKNDFFEYMLNNSLKLLKINCLIQVLGIIKINLAHPENVLKSRNQLELPNLKFIDKTIDQIENLINGEGNEGNFTLRRRQNQINSELDSFSSCFKTVYKYGSKEQDLSEAYNNYIKDESNKLTYQILLENSSILEYFEKYNNMLYSKIIKSSSQHVKRVNIFESTTLFDILNNLKRGDIQNDSIINLFESNKYKLKEKIPAMLKLKEDEFQFGEDPSAKLIVLTSDHKQYGQLFKEYRISNNNDNTTDQPSLKDTIIFYQEYGFMGENSKVIFNPIFQLRHMNDVKNWIKHKLDDKYINEKVPYLSLNQFNTYL